MARSIAEKVSCKLQLVRRWQLEQFDKSKRHCDATNVWRDDGCWRRINGALPETRYQTDFHK
jgi:hypothetical protein